MSVYKSLRLAVAGSLVLAMPFQAGTAAVRAQTAVPAGTTDVCTQRDNPDAAGYCARLDEAAAVRGGVAWPAIGVIVATIVTAVVIERNNGRGRGTGFSR